MKIDVCSIDKCQSELIWNGCAIKRLFESRSEFMAIRHSRLHSGNLKSTCNKYVSIRSKLWNKMLLGAHQNLCSSHFTNHQYSIFRTVRHNEMRHERRLRWAARVDAPNFAHSKKKKIHVFFWKFPRGFDQRKLLLQWTMWSIQFPNRMPWRTMHLPLRNDSGPDAWWKLWMQRYA